MYRLEEDAREQAGQQVKTGDIVECRDMPVKILAEMADVLDQAYHSLSKAELIAHSAMATFAAQRELVAQQKYQLAMLMGAGVKYR